MRNEILTLSLHDALPIFSSSRKKSTIKAGKTVRCRERRIQKQRASPTSSCRGPGWRCRPSEWSRSSTSRSEEHTSELQSRFDLVCRLLLEKKKKSKNTIV